jgi:hypothetical protein
VPRSLRIRLIVLATLAVPFWSALGSWDENGTPICTETGAQFEAVITSDGGGGAIIAWTDARGSSGDIYAQRVDGTGVSQWAVGGVRIGGTASSDYQPRIVADDAGGAIIAWLTNGTRAQRIDPNGNVLWDSAGVVVDAATTPAGTSGRSSTSIMSTEYPIDAVTDGAGGVIIVYQPYQTGQFRAQRIDGSGNMLWTGGAPVCTLTTSNAFKPAMAPDGAGGAIIAWEDTRFDFQSDIFAQRVDASGTPLWTPNGVAVATASNYQENVYLTSDGVGGAIMTWRDLRLNSQTYAQRIDALGTPLWTTDGDLFAQCMDTTGTVWWYPDGDSVCTAVGWQHTPAMVSVGNGSVIFAWDDRRTGSYTSNYDVYAQRMSGAVTSVPARPPRATPLAIYPNVPNPFNATTDIVVGLSVPSSVRVEVFDVLGRRVRVLEQGATETGVRRILFDGRDTTGQLLASGAYFYRVIAGGSIASSKMIIQR